MMSEMRWQVLNAAHMPTWIKANLYEASIGGQNSYSTAGWHVGIHLDSIIQNLEDQYARAKEEWQNLDKANDAQMLGWCKKYIRHIMRHIPGARRHRFFEGIRQAYEEDRIEI